MILENQKHLFEIPDDVTFLNCANMSPQLKSMTIAGQNAVKRKAESWNIKLDDWFTPVEGVRKLLAKIINGDKENIALVPSVSYGIVTAAKNISISSNQNIVVLDQQYPSNIYAWRELAVEKGATIITTNKNPGQSSTEALLE